jgi:glycosyltransferase involved in cell wall biosynthesis
MTAAAIDDEIRVLYLTGGRRIGGMENHLIALASSLPSSIRCLVCCLEASSDYQTRLTMAGIEHVNLGWPILLRPSGLPIYLRLERLVGRFRPHIVHSYGFAADIVAGVLRTRRADVRLITSRRGEDANKRHQALRRLVNRVSERVVCVSAETAAFVQATESPSRSLLTVIPNGVAVNPVRLRASARGRDRPVRFGALGTVKPIKGTDLLVDAFMRFKQTDRVELLIAGLIDRPWAEALRERARKDPRIRFLGRESQPDGFLSHVDVFVLPSRSEGMSNALLEAMASGLPCIATDVGSNRSLLNHPAEPAAGLICDGNPESLFRAMAEMASSAEARLEYGAHAARLVTRHYTIPGMVRQYEGLYRSVVGRPPRARFDTPGDGMTAHG